MRETSAGNCNALLPLEPRSTVSASIDPMHRSALSRISSARRAASFAACDHQRKTPSSSSQGAWKFIAVVRANSSAAVQHRSPSRLRTSGARSEP